MADTNQAYIALAKAQAEMGKAVKSSTNPHFRAKYADLGAVQDACMPALHDNGFAVFQPTGRDDAGPFVKTIFAHESGAVLECLTPLLIDKNNMQGLGSAITYARRYGLLCMAGIAPEDDDGSATVDQSRANHAPPKPPPPTDETAADEAVWAFGTCTTPEEYEQQWAAVAKKFGGNNNVPESVVEKARETARKVGYVKKEAA